MHLKTFNNFPEVQRNAVNNGVTPAPSDPAGSAAATAAMTSPEREEEEEEGEQPPEVRLGFVFGNGAAVTRWQTPLVPPGDAAEPSSEETISLSRSELQRVPERLLKSSALKCLCLEGNHISSLPPSMFASLPNLLWLDVRRNRIASLPPEIGSHRNLRTLLLEGNPISELPAELGNLISLKGLNLRDCPVRFPPQHVLHQGLQAILQHLRSALAQRPLGARKTPPPELPAVEKLQLSELTAPGVEEQEEGPAEDEGELQRFLELKEKLILLDRAELGDNKSQVPSVRQPKKAASIAELPPFDPQRRRRPEAAVKEMREKQAILEQRKKSQEALQKWRARARLAQEKKELKKKKLERQRKLEEEASRSGWEDDGGAPQRFHTSGEECEEDRSTRELERRIRAHVDKMHERRSNPRGSAAEQVAAAEKDVKEMKALQTRLLQRKKNLGKHLGNTFTIFTADTWPSFADK